MISCRFVRILMNRSSSYKNKIPPCIESARESKGKKGPERNVTGIRIEFKTDEERARFVDTVKRVQENMLPLPDI